MQDSSPVTVENIWMPTWKPVEPHFDISNLKPVTGRPKIQVYLKQLWQRRYFIIAESKAKAFQSSRNMILGHAWLILSPLLDAIVYGVVFGYLLKTSKGVDHFIPFLFIGVTYFSFVTRPLMGGVGLIRGNRNVIKAFAFPRASLVISNSIRDFIDSLPVIVMSLVVVVFLPQGTGRPYLTWLLFPIVYLLLFVFGLGLCFFSAWATSIIPDLRTIFTFFTRFWFYISGVFFSVSRFKEHPEIIAVMESNPAYLILDMIRDVLIYNRVPSVYHWTFLTICSFGTLVISFILFWSREVHYAKG
ncbi:hypothetical protein BK816_00485 [Boudabousia tangfeifanii]|uniref:Transport permease protein n=1 Tax=Boudabousia tangfeifanii TaxID=1912795 RepID=A0A1D9MI46_9ACTO|nr:ABC transporter permease [Boudabousia tangfeifanii]AOZ71954.1 hypothetical protein BK816_00485 [Boudabousia tangfeifanii]